MKLKKVVWWVWTLWHSKRHLLCWLVTLAAYWLTILAGTVTRKLIGVQAARMIWEASWDIQTAKRNLKPWR